MKKINFAPFAVLSLIVSTSTLPAFADDLPAPETHVAETTTTVTTTTETTTTPDIKHYESVIVNNKGTKIGDLSLRDGGNGTVVRVDIRKSNLKPGWHAMHLHAAGDCSDHAKFEHAKAHINSDGKKHGLLSTEGPEAGDLTNIFINRDGSGNSEVLTSLRLEDGENSLRDSDGSALVIHANEDDLSTQPTGNSGARVACSVIKQ